MAERGGPRTLVKGAGVRERMPPNPVPPSVPSMPVRSSCPAPRGPGRSPSQGRGTYQVSVVPRAFGWGAGSREWMHPNPMPPSEPARPDGGPPPGPPQGPGRRPSLEQVEEALDGER